MNIKATALLLSLDALWLSTYMGPQYRKMIPRIQLDEMSPKLLYALFAYTLLVAGLNIFVIPNINKFNDSIKYGFLFGIIIYGVYDFTAAAIFNKWDIKLAVIDILWGGMLYFLSAYYGTK